LLVDDHALVRAGLRALLENIPGVEVVGEASNGREAQELVRLELPNLVLMDIAMPERNPAKIAEGKNTREVASLLEISVRTVEARRQPLMARLEIHDVPGLVRDAIRDGLTLLVLFFRLRNGLASSGGGENATRSKA
jgi:DNA-binding NarL/FixJ family response regulator